MIPSEDRDESIAVEFLRDHRQRPWLLLALGVLAVLAVITLSEVDFWPGPGNLWLGGDARRRRARLGVRDRPGERQPAARCRRRRRGDRAIVDAPAAPRHRPAAPNGGSRSFRRSPARCSSPPASSGFSPCSMCTTSTCPSCWPPPSRSSARGRRRLPAGTSRRGPDRPRPRAARRLRRRRDALPVDLSSGIGDRNERPLAAGCDRARVRARDRRLHRRARRRRSPRGDDPRRRRSSGSGSSSSRCPRTSRS